MLIFYFILLIMNVCLCELYYKYIKFDRVAIINRIVRNHYKEIKSSLLNDYTKYTIFSYNMGITEYVDNNVINRLKSILMKKGFSVDIELKKYDTYLIIK